MSKLIFVQDIDLLHSPKVRFELRPEVVDDYVSVYRANKKVMPPIVVFSPDNRQFILADGAHRLSAQLKMNAKAVVAEVKRGGYEEALSYALNANEKHGVRRSREDKRQCIAAAILQWPKLSNREIAQVAVVDDHTVKAVRDELEKAAEVKPEPVRSAKGGRTTNASHAKKEKPAPEANAEFRIAQNPEPQQAVDSIGRIVPKYALQYWSRIDEVKAVLKQLDGVMGELKRAQKEQDLMYAPVNISGVLADMDRVWSAIQTAIPYTLCTQCHGHPDKQANKECRLCKSKGLISKFLWDTAIPAETKNMLRRQHK